MPILRHLPNNTEQFADWAGRADWYKIIRGVKHPLTPPARDGPALKEITSHRVTTESPILDSNFQFPQHSIPARIINFDIPTHPIVTSPSLSVVGKIPVQITRKNTRSRLIVANTVGRTAFRSVFTGRMTVNV